MTSFEKAFYSGAIFENKKQSYLITHFLQTNSHFSNEILPDFCSSCMFFDGCHNFVENFSASSSITNNQTLAVVCRLQQLSDFEYYFFLPCSTVEIRFSCLVVPAGVCLNNDKDEKLQGVQPNLILYLKGTKRNYLLTPKSMVVFKVAKNLLQVCFW